MRRKISSTTITTDEPMNYDLMNEEEALQEIKKVTEEVNEILRLPSTTLVRVILNYFRWDQNTLTGQSRMLRSAPTSSVISFEFRTVLRRSRRTVSESQYRQSVHVPITSVGSSFSWLPTCRPPSALWHSDDHQSFRHHVQNVGYVSDLTRKA
jgi:hypothetical protein